MRLLVFNAAVMIASAGGDLWQHKVPWLALGWLLGTVGMFLHCRAEDAK